MLSHIYMGDVLFELKLGTWTILTKSFRHFTLCLAARNSLCVKYTDMGNTSYYGY